MDKKEDTLTVRIDTRAGDQLTELVKHFTEQSPLGPVTVSQIVRAAIDEMHVKHVRSPS